MITTSPTTPYTDQYIQVGEIKTRYWYLNESGNDAAPACVLIHGIACSVLEWQHNAAALATTHRVYVFDLLGCGLTDKPVDETYTIARLAQFTLDFMTAVGLERAHLAGNSLGGSISLECARVAPQRVASMLLVDPAAIDRVGTLLEFRLTTLPFLGELLSKPNAIGTRMLWRKAVAHPDKHITDDLVRTKVALARLPGAHEAFLKTLRSFVDLTGFKAAHVQALHLALPGIATPTLVLWGRQDGFITVSHAQVLGSLLPNAQVEIWDDCGHVPQIEYPEKFNERARLFWQTLDLDAK